MNPWDFPAPRDYPDRNVIPLHRSVVPLAPYRAARATRDAEMLEAIEARLNEVRHVTVDRDCLRRENIARFYRANPQFAPVEPHLSEAWFYVLGGISALLWIAAFVVAGREGWF